MEFGGPSCGKTLSGTALASRFGEKKREELDFMLLFDETGKM